MTILRNLLKEVVDRARLEFAPCGYYVHKVSRPLDCEPSDLPADLPAHARFFSTYAFLKILSALHETKLDIYSESKRESFNFDIFSQELSPFVSEEIRTIVSVL